MRCRGACFLLSLHPFIAAYRRRVLSFPSRRSVMSHSAKRAARSRRAAGSAAVAESLEQRQMLSTATVYVSPGSAAAEQDEACGSFIFSRSYACGLDYASALT